MNDNERMNGVQKSISCDTFRDKKKLLMHRRSMPYMQVIENQEPKTPRNNPTEPNTNIRMLNGIYSQTEPLTSRSGYSGMAESLALPAAGKGRTYTYDQPKPSSASPRTAGTSTPADRRRKISLPHPNTICLRCSKQRTIRRSRTTGCLTNLDRAQTPDVRWGDDGSVRSSGRPQTRSEVLRTLKQESVMKQTDSLGRMATARVPKTPITTPISSDVDAGNEKPDTGTSGPEIETTVLSDKCRKGEKKYVVSGENEQKSVATETLETNVVAALSKEAMKKRDKQSAVGSDAAVAEKVLFWMETLPEKFSGLNPLQIIPTYEPPQRERNRNDEEY